MLMNGMTGVELGLESRGRVPWLKLILAPGLAYAVPAKRAQNQLAC